MSERLVPPNAVCAFCGRAIALAERPTLDGAEWFCSRDCEEACDADSSDVPEWTL